MLLLLELAAGLLVAALLLLALPVEVRFQVRGIEPLQGQWAIRVLFVRWRQHLVLSTPGQDRAVAPVGVDHETASRPGRRRSAGRVRLQALWHDARFRRRALSRLRAAIDTVRWHGLHLRLRLGLEDPADTGRLWGLLGPLSAGLANLRAADIAIEPVFAGPALDFDARGRLVFVPLQLLGSMVVLAVLVALAIVRQHRGRLRRAP